MRKVREVVADEFVQDIAKAPEPRAPEWSRLLNWLSNLNVDSREQWVCADRARDYRTTKQYNRQQHDRWDTSLCSFLLPRLSGRFFVSA